MKMTMNGTIDKGRKAYDAAEEEDKLTDTLRISTETMTWQMLATFIKNVN